MKKRIAVLIGVLIIGLTACGSSNSASGGDNVAGKPAADASSAQTDSSNNAEGVYSSYEEIYEAYAKKLMDTTPGLIEEYKTEAASNDKGVTGLAEISNSKVTKLAEISTEGTEEMASFMIKNDAGNSDKYQEWANKLTQVYQSEAQKITDVYMQSITGETENTESAEAKSESGKEEIIPTETPTPEPTEAPAEIETTQLYKDFFEPYTDSVGTLLDAGFSTVEKLNEYQVEHTPGSEEDLCEYRIYDENGDYVYMSFFPADLSGNAEEWIWTLSLLTYERNGKEISINDNTHSYNKPIMKTYDPDRDPKSVEVKTIDELVSFMFG